MALRTPDLIAKIAGVTLKDTIRVLIAADLVAKNNKQTFEQMFGTSVIDGLSAIRPEVANVIACDKAYLEMNRQLRNDAAMSQWAEEIKRFK